MVIAVEFGGSTRRSGPSVGRDAVAGRSRSRRALPRAPARASRLAGASAPMLLAKLKELRALEAQEEEAKAAVVSAPKKKKKKTRRTKKDAERERGNEVAMHGWAKVRRCGLKAARAALRAKDGDVEDEPDGPIRRLRGHRGAVLCVALSPDGARLFTGGRDGDVRAWDHLREGRCELVMSGHVGAVCALAVDPDGERVFSAGADNVVRVWEIRDGTCLRASNLFQMTHLDPRSYDVDTDAPLPQTAYSSSFAVRPKVYGVVLSHDAKRCFAGCSDKDVKCWDVKTGTLRLALKGHDGPVGAMAAFHTTKTRIVTGSGDATIRAWDLERSRCDCVMTGHAGAVLALAVASDDSRVYSGGADGDVRVWSVSFVEGALGACTASCHFTVPAAHVGRSVRCVTVTRSAGGADRGTMFTGGEDGTVRARGAPATARNCARFGDTMIGCRASSSTGTNGWRARGRTTDRSWCGGSGR